MSGADTDRLLVICPIPERYAAHFVKQVRYYLDYREKYGIDQQLR